MKETFRSEYVRCGKRGCGGCPHGPYWYAYHKAGGRTHKRYVGKHLERTPAAGHPHDKIFSREDASLKLAWDILGCEDTDNREVARRAFSVAIGAAHPDRGGDEILARRVNAAWSYVKAVKGW